jgi:hypothetical protein
MRDYCDGSDFEDLGIRPEVVRQLWSDFQARRGSRTDLLWQMFMLAAWSRRFRSSGAPKVAA